jgi:hypothetical protein
MMIPTHSTLPLPRDLARGQHIEKKNYTVELTDDPGRVHYTHPGGPNHCVHYTQLKTK